MRLLTLVPLLAASAGHALPQTASAPDSAVMASASAAANKIQNGNFGAPTPPWKAGSKPGWYYGHQGPPFGVPSFIDQVGCIIHFLWCEVETTCCAADSVRDPGEFFPLQGVPFPSARAPAPVQELVDSGQIVCAGHICSFLCTGHLCSFLRTGHICSLLRAGNLCSFLHAGHI